jgi:predicted O-methyltransferase YrrM
MDHFYRNIQGWFNFSDLYKDAINQFDNAKFLELGCWKGRSAAFMAVEIINSNKNIEFYCVDSWKGDKVGGVGKVDVYDEFVKNMQPVLDKINIVRELSVDAAKQFPDHSLDFVFIDASHDYESVKEDFEVWFPKMKKGGMMAGHDYGYPSVKKAIDECLDKYNMHLIKKYGYSWAAMV